MATIYAGPGVSYGSGAGTEGNPYSILEALENISPGVDSEVVLLDGNYTDAGIFNFGADGSKSVFEYGTQESERVTIRGESANGVLWTPSSGQVFRLQQTCKYLTIKDLTINGQNYNASSSAYIQIFTQHGSTLTDIILDHLTIYNCGSHGIQWDAWTTNSIMRNCVVYDAGRTDGASNCVYLNGGYNNEVVDNLFYYTAARTMVGHGCLRAYINGSQIGSVGAGGGPAAVEGHDNLIHRNEIRGGTFGIAFTGNDEVVKNNVVVMGPSTSVGIWVFEQSEGTNDGQDIWNNTVTLASGVSGTGKDGIAFYRGIAVDAGVDIANNGIYGPATAINLTGITDTVVPARNATNLTSDPGFGGSGNSPAGIAAYDFRITPSGNWDEKGTDLTASGVTTDKAGLARPQNTLFDVGAFEAEVPPDADPVNGIDPSYNAIVGSLTNLNLSTSDPDNDVNGDATSEEGVWIKISGNSGNVTLSGSSTGTGTLVKA